MRIFVKRQCRGWTSRLLLNSFRGKHMSVCTVFLFSCGWQTPSFLINDCSTHRSQKRFALVLISLIFLFYIITLTSPQGRDSGTFPHILQPNNLLFGLCTVNHRASPKQCNGECGTTFFMILSLNMQKHFQGRRRGQAQRNSLLWHWKWILEHLGMD